MEVRKRVLRAKVSSGKRIRLGDDLPEKSTKEIVVKFTEECGLKLGSSVGPNVSDKDDNTLLHYAARYGNDEMIKKILSSGAFNVNVRNRWGETPLHLAALTLREDTVTTLMDRGASTDEWENLSGLKPLHYAFGHTKCKSICKRENRLRTVKSDPYTAEKRIKIAKIMLRGPVKGITMRYGDLLMGVNPISFSAISGDTNLLRALINLGIDINTRSKDGKTLLIYACEFGREDTAEMLMEMGADTGAKDNYECTVLSSACKGGLIDVVKSLSKDNTAIIQQDRFGLTGLHHAVRGGHYNIVRFLTSKLDRVDEVIDVCGRAPLWFAADNGYIDSVRLLVAKGADPNRANKKGITAAQTARYKGHSQVADSLEGSYPLFSYNQNFVGQDSPTSLLISSH